MSARPTFVLVHGGGSTARFWDRLVPLLDGDVLAVDLPGRASKPADLPALTVDDEVASVVADIRAASLRAPIVLVVHSSGGLVVPGVLAALDGAIDRVVLNAASVPPEGGCGLDCMQPRHRAGLEPAKAAFLESGRAFTTLGPPDDPEAFRNTYGTTLSDEDLAFVVDPVRCVVDTVSHYFQPVSWKAAPPTPITYVVNRRDRPVPADLQREMAGRLPEPPALVELDTGHIPAVVEPELFASIVHAACA